MHRRLADLYQSVNALPSTPEMLPKPFKVIGSTSKIVQLAIEELYQQNEELLETPIGRSRTPTLPGFI